MKLFLFILPAVLLSGKISTYSQNISADTLICAYHNVRVNRLEDINKKNLNAAYIVISWLNINFDEASTGKFIISNKTTHACATITMNTLANAPFCDKITNIKFLPSSAVKPRPLGRGYKA